MHQVTPVPRVAMLPGHQVYQLNQNRELSSPTAHRPPPTPTTPLPHTHSQLTLVILLEVFMLKCEKGDSSSLGLLCRGLAATDPVRVSPTPNRSRIRMLLLTADKEFLVTTQAADVANCSYGQTSSKSVSPTQETVANYRYGQVS